MVRLSENTFVLTEGAGIHEEYFVLTAKISGQTDFSPRALFAQGMGKEVAIAAAQAIVAQFPGWRLDYDLEYI